MKLPVDSNGVLYDHFCCRFPKKKKKKAANIECHFFNKRKFFCLIVFPHLWEGTQRKFVF
jgi:hypothetical protein